MYLYLIFENVDCTHTCENGFVLILVLSFDVSIAVNANFVLIFMEMMSMGTPTHKQR